MNLFILLMDTLFARLAWTAAQGTLLIGALWLLLRYMPRLSPAMRCMLWWLVALQLTLGVTLSTPVQLHWLTPSPSVAVAPHVVASEMATSAPPAAPALRQDREPTTVSQSATTAWSWPEVLVTMWLLGVLWQCLLVAIQWRENRLLLRSAQPVQDVALKALFAEQARKLGMRRTLRLLTSDAIVSPQVTGVLWPVVLLPRASNLSSDELEMVMAHELAHLHRGDLWLGWIPATAQRLFFFHPLVKWAMREYAIYREAACDAQVLQRHRAAPHAYGHLLVRLGVATPMHSSLAGASSTFRNLKRRLLMLEQNQTAPRARGWLLVIAIAFAGVLPYRVTASNAEPGNTIQAISPEEAVTVSSIPVALATPQFLAPTASAPSAPIAPALRSPITPTRKVVPVLRAIATAKPATQRQLSQAAVAATPVTPAPANLDIHVQHVDIGPSQASREIALFDGENLLLAGSDTGLAEVRRLNKADQPMLWFRSGDQAYVIYDADVLHQAQQAVTSILKSTQDQALVAQQSALTAQQNVLAEREQELANGQAMLTYRRKRIEAQVVALEAEALADGSQGREALGQARALNTQLSDIDQQTTAISRQTQVLTNQQAIMSEYEADMSAQREAAVVQANQQLDRVLNDAVLEGQAQPVVR